MSTYKYYKELTIDEKINFKSYRFWRLPNDGGFMLTMMDNADSFNREDYANFTRHCVADRGCYSMPRHNNNKFIYDKLYYGKL